jgi:hypothetical protein
MFAPYGRPLCTVVRKGDTDWTVSSIGEGAFLETIAFEEILDGRQLYVYADTHEGAVAVFESTDVSGLETLSHIG